MRSVLARLALIGTFGIAMTGCGSSGTSLPVGSFPNNAGGAPGSAVSNQAPVPTSIASKPLIGAYTAANSFVGFNTTATDAASATDYGTDPRPADSGLPPAAPGGSHLITFVGNNTPVINLKFNGTVGALTIPAVLPGQFLAQTYGSIVLHAPSPLPTLGTASPTSLFVELVGGSPAYDVRVNCTVPAVTAPATVPMNNGLVRYVCPLPAYGSPSTAGIQQPVLAGATGAFDPIGNSTFYVGETYGATATSPAASGSLNLDYVYAEQGTL